MKAMSMRAKNPRKFKDLEEVEKIFMKKRDRHKADQLFHRRRDIINARTYDLNIAIIDTS